MNTTILCVAILFCFGYQVQASIWSNNWKCFDGRCYYFSTGVANNWHAARADCRARGGDLAVPTNRINNHHIYEAIKERNIKRVFIGLYRVAASVATDRFYTVRGIQASYTNWFPTKPDNYRGNEGCGELVFKAPYLKSGADVAGQWDDIPCYTHPRHYVCQMSFKN